MQGPDLSLAYRPNLEKNNVKEKKDYRNFETGSLIDRVFSTYKLMHSNQTLEFVKQKHAEWCSCNHTKMGMMDAIMSLDQLVDESDPDVDFPNSFHAFQTAEGIRQAHPDKDWFHLVGLIHDVGKIMALWEEPQGLYMIRFHSFYPWHSHGDYMHLCSKKDQHMLPWVQEFNKFDLYTKTTDLPDIDKLKPYYQSLIDKYCPGVIKW
ncbi:Inositol oxygenase [Channa argus]|uniref:Inositol oxygenase n=1 Tax=Channa argus TaxID=215402 RepID=A0A6G1PFS1_CHAAH|nr:Inositol oxygenase [Channa argus]